MAADIHGHALQGKQALVFFGRIGREHFFDDHHVVLDLGELMDEFAVVAGHVDLVAELVERGLRRFLQLHRRERDQRGLVCRC